jgi:hypothetical protein|eukprot:SAG25_NODE_2596_length_1507_cov_0.955256_2_plen_162_part_00
MLSWLVDLRFQNCRRRDEACQYHVLWIPDNCMTWRDTTHTYTHIPSRNTYYDTSMESWTAWHCCCSLPYGSPRLSTPSSIAIGPSLCATPGPGCCICCCCCCCCKWGTLSQIEPWAQAWCFRREWQDGVTHLRTGIPTPPGAAHHQHAVQCRPVAPNLLPA